MSDESRSNGRSEPEPAVVGPLSAVRAGELVGAINAVLQPLEQAASPSLRAPLPPERLNTLAKNLIRLMPASDLVRFARELVRLAEEIDGVFLPKPRPDQDPAAVARPAPRPEVQKAKEKPAKKDKVQTTPLTDEQKERIKNLYSLSRSYEEIAREVGVTTNQVRTFMLYQNAKAKQPGTPDDHPQ